jgi:excisionase family DNA binding protein
MADSYMTLREVAELLKLSEKTLYRLAQQGEIPAFKVGGSWRFRRTDIEMWIARRIDDQRPT